MTAAPGTVQIGAWEFPPPDAGEGVAVVNWVSAAKIDEAASDGKNDARTTFRGRMPGKVEISLRWRERGALGQPTATDLYAVRMLAALSPRGPNAGKPFEVVAQDQEIHNAHTIIIKELKGPVRVPGSGEATATLSCDTWAKQKPVQVKKTPTRAEAWGKFAKDLPLTQIAPEPEGFGNPGTAPAVKP